MQKNHIFFSIIIPVYNRPDEVDELLQSLIKQDFENPFEIVIIEDGSTLNCQKIVDKFKTELFISYYFKSNSGPGDSRNFGMQKAKGNYFIILDSDCILPLQYLSTVNKFLEQEFVDCFGGPDGALDSFSDIQKAINFTMTSFLTTGGVRGGSEKITKFQPRSFNMGLSYKAFVASKGFKQIHPGEDPDLSIRLWDLGFQTQLISEAYVYHKRRVDWVKFAVQVNKFGKARPILNVWHPKYQKITFFFPSIFIVGFFLAIFISYYTFLPLFFYTFYFVLLFFVSYIQNRSFKIGVFSVYATFLQFYYYGIGFLESFIKVQILKQKPEKSFPKLFFKQ